MDSPDDVRRGSGTGSSGGTHSPEGRIKSTSQEALEAAKAQGQAKLEQARDSTAASANRTADALMQTADNLAAQGDEGLARAVSALGSKLSQLAGDLEHRNVEDLAREAARLAREHPGMFIAGGLALGFALTRFFRASAPEQRTAADATSAGVYPGSAARPPAPPAATRPGTTPGYPSDSTGTLGGVYE